MIALSFDRSYKYICYLLLDKCQVNDAFTVVYSGGRDRRVWATDLRNSNNHMLLCEERAPVLKVY